MAYEIDKRKYALILLTIVFLFSGIIKLGFSENTAAYSWDRILENVGITKGKITSNYGSDFDSGRILETIKNPFNNWDVILLKYLPVFLLTFLIIYAVLSEINFFENDNIMRALAAVISLVAFVGGYVGIVAYIISNFIAIGVLTVFFALMYIGLGYFYRRKLNQWNYSTFGRSFFYIFVTHLPLIFATIIVVSTLWYYIMGNLPGTGAKGIILGGLIGGILLALEY